jgi:hypothetical protein
MQRWRWGPEAFLVFAHDHDDLSAIRQGRAFGYFGRISRLSSGDNADVMFARTHRISAVTMRQTASLQRRLNEPVIDQALKTILCPARHN